MHFMVALYMEIFELLFYLMIITVGLFSGSGVAGRSDYNVGDKDAIVPDPLPSKKSRSRRRRRKQLEQMDRDANKAGDSYSHQP